MKFELNEEQLVKLQEWKDKINKEIIEKWPKRCILGRPYYGATGGGYEYKFTPTSLGIIVSVTEYWTKETIDLTNEGGFG